jgi:hypothetical protein
MDSKATTQSRFMDVSPRLGSARCRTMLPLLMIGIKVPRGLP